MSLGRRVDMVKVLWWNCGSQCLLPNQLKRGRFVWP
ncbi:IS66 family insertion sequence element accessory protein TnpB [Janthinobacterium sp. UMAB-56]